MSFYGQVLYEFKKLFTHIQTKNSNNNNIPDDFSVSPVLVEADSDWDTLNLETGNQWIQFKTDKNNNKISIYHNTPSKDDNEEDYTFFGVLDGTPSAQIGDQLTFGQTIQFNKGKKDKAGHIVIEETKEMELPNLLLSIDNGDTTQRDYSVEKKKDNILQFISNEMIHLSPTDENSGINIFHRENANIDPDEGHTSIYDAEDKRVELSCISIVGDALKEWLENNNLEAIKQLETHSIIRVPVIDYDNSGHGLSYRYDYYKMPFTKEQQIQDQNSSDIKKLRAYTGILFNHPDTFPTNDKGEFYVSEEETLYGRIEKINSFLDGKEASKLTDIEADITTNKNNIGDLNANVFKNTLSSDKYTTIFDSKNKNLSAAIGSLETLSQAIHNSKLKLDIVDENNKIEIKDISSLLSNLCSEVIDEHSQDISEIRAEQGTLQLAVGTNRNDINALKKTVYGINNESEIVVGLDTKVQQNIDAINILNGSTSIVGSVDYKVQQVKDQLNTTNENVGKNSTAIEKLNGSIDSEGSVDYKINQQIIPLDERIDDIESTLNDESEGLIKKVGDNTASISSLTETIGDDSKGLIQKVNLNASVATSNEGNITALTNRINLISYNNTNDTVENIINDLDSKINQISYKNTTDTVENVIADLVVRITALEGNNSNI